MSNPPTPVRQISIPATIERGDPPCPAPSACTACSPRRPRASTRLSSTLKQSQITIGGQTTQFHYDGDALVGEYVGTTLTGRYVHSGEVDEPWLQYNGASVGASHRRYLHADHQGSIIAHSDYLGSVILKNAYDPYGIPKSTNAGRFGYTGQTVIPQLGLNYYKARFYAPRLGRFLQTDPIFYKDDMNLYAYVGNDPTNKVDPDGQLAWFIPVIWGIGALMASDAANAPGPDDIPEPRGAAASSGIGGLSPGGGSLRSVVMNAASRGAPKTVVIDKRKYPESAAHAEAAQAAGKPAVVTVDRAGAAARRQEAMQGTKPTSGKDRDEYPPAMFKEGGAGASVQPINPSDNRGAGASLGKQCSSVKDGDQVRIVCK